MNNDDLTHAEKRRIRRRQASQDAMIKCFCFLICMGLCILVTNKFGHEPNSIGGIAVGGACISFALAFSNFMDWIHYSGDEKPSWRDIDC